MTARSRNPSSKSVTASTLMFVAVTVATVIGFVSQMLHCHDEFVDLAGVPRLLSKFFARTIHEKQVHPESSSSSPPLYVVILAGQSNMVGMGSIEHLDLLVSGNRSTSVLPRMSRSGANPYRDKLYNESSGTYRVSDRVYVKFGAGTTARPLTADRDSGFAAHGCFGPELMIGWTLNEDASVSVTDDGSKFLLIKTAWGGKSLAVDFRPPSSGSANYSSNLKPLDYGRYYRAMVDDVIETLGNLSRHVPSYDPKVSTYQLLGLVWFQGWNDLISWPFVEEYGPNLRNFIRDVRRDLSSPDLPVVVGELGQNGITLDSKQKWTPRVLAMRTQQHAVTLLPEFVRTTQFVPTARYVVPSNNGTTHYYNGDYHYGGRADTFFHIGKAMGRAVLKLARGRGALPRQRTITFSNAGIEVKREATVRLRNEQSDTTPMQT